MIRNIAELRDAVRDFVELYNAQWIVVEKNGYLSPAQARQAWHAAISIQARRVRQTCVQGTGCAQPMLHLALPDLLEADNGGGRKPGRLRPKERRKRLGEIADVEMPFR